MPVWISSSTQPRAAGAIAVLALLASAATTLPARAFQGARTYQVQPDGSRIVIDVGKSGLFSFAAGHTHRVETSALTGSVSVDPQDTLRSEVNVHVDASALRVTGEGEPPDDVPKVQAAMLGDQVLDVQRYPTIDFESRRMTRRAGASGPDLLVTGDLTLHNVTRSITVPVTVRIDGDRVGATAQFTVKQSDYGIKPVSVGGVVAVKDELTIRLTIVAVAP